MIVSLVVAASENHAIGKDNKLLWRLPNDLKFFKNTTWAMPVIMGRKTFESMAGKPLLGRLNIVITRQKDWSAKGVVTVHSMKDALFVASAGDYKEAFVIGGGEIYRDTMPKADRIYLTRVHANLEGDAFFPELDARHWKMVSNELHQPDSSHPYSYSFQVWEKK